MFSDLSTTARAVTFYLLALAMCVAMAVAVPDGGAAAVLAMATPTASVLLMQLVVTRDGWRRGGWSSLGLGRLGTAAWGISFLAPLGVLLVSEAAVRVTGLTAWHLPSLLDSRDLVLALVMLPFFCIFEELGWRGYLTPLLGGRGSVAPHLLTGFAHGVWHLPLVFLATDAYLTDGNRWVVVPVFLGVLTCSGPIYAWTRLTTGSVYPAVLLHTTFNWGLSVIAVLVTTSRPDAVATLGREAGIATLVVLAAAALWVWNRPVSGRTVAAATGTSVPVQRVSA